MLASPIAAAGDVDLFAGYNFIRDATTSSIGYQSSFGLGAELVLISTGKEEPNTKPGPEICFNGVLYVPRQPVFVKAGLVTGNGKDGYDLGFGFDLDITRQWGLRLQETHFRVREDYNRSSESENLVSLGLTFRF